MTTPAWRPVAAAVPAQQREEVVAPRPAQAQAERRDDGFQDAQRPPVAPDSHMRRSGESADPQPGPVSGADGELPAQLDLEFALHTFHRVGFDLLLADAAVDMARGDVATAAAVANPQINGSVGHTGGHYHPSQCGGPGCSATAYAAGVTDAGALVDVLGGKRALRRAVAQAALQVAQFGAEDARRTLDLVLKNQYLAVATDAANLAFKKNVRKSFAATLHMFDVRYAAGDISEADVVRVQTAASEAEQDVDAAQGQLEQDRAALTFLLGVRGATTAYVPPSGWLESVPQVPLDQAARVHWIAVATARRPDLLSQRAQQRRAQALVQLGRRQLLPDVAIGLNFQQEGTGETALQPPTYTAGLTLTLPMFYQFQGEIARAWADVAAQDVAYARAQAQLVADVTTACAAMRAGQRRLARMQASLRVQATRALELVRLQYDKGAASLLDLLDAQRTFTAVNQAYLGDLTAFWSALFGLEAAVAMDLR